MKKSSVIALTLALLTWVQMSVASELDTPISVNVRNAPIKQVLETIAAKTGLRLYVDSDLNITISIAEVDMSARKLLDKLAAENAIEYTVNGNQLLVDRVKANVANTAGGDSHEIILRNAIASELVTKITSVISGDGKILADEHSNKLIYVGSDKTFERVKTLVSHFDSPQKQIMIEAIIVETSHNFLQEIGVSFGGSNSSGSLSGTVNTAAPTSPNLSFNAILGKVNSNALNLRLTAAETKGDAKIVSRPKIVTLNNRAAKVESGVTLNIKTLSNVSAGTAPSSTTSANQGVVTGSVTSIDAVLSLNILPLLIGDDDIKLTVDINDAAPDLSNAIDGIPGILKNSASTAVIIKNKQTAVIAGLIKQTKSKSSTGIPFLSDIPLLGMLFKSHSVTDTNNELVIFLTPTIDDRVEGVAATATVDPALLVQSQLKP